LRIGLANLDDVWLWVRGAEPLGTRFLRHAVAAITGVQHVYTARDRWRWERIRFHGTRAADHVRNHERAHSEGKIAHGDPALPMASNIDPSTQLIAPAEAGEVVRMEIHDVKV
jgi:hypothetical protein